MAFTKEFAVFLRIFEQDFGETVVVPTLFLQDFVKDFQKLFFVWLWVKVKVFHSIMIVI